MVVNVINHNNESLKSHKHANKFFRRIFITLALTFLIEFIIFIQK